MKKQLLILWALLFGIFSYSQTEVVRFPLTNNLNFQAPPAPPAGTVLTYHSSNGNVKTPTYESSWLRGAGAGDYLELSINASTLENLSINFSTRFSSFIGNGTWNVSANTGANNTFQQFATHTLGSVFGSTSNGNLLESLPAVANGKADLKIRIQVDFGWNLGDNLRINNLRLLTGNPNIRISSNINIEIPNIADALEGYNTVFSDLQTLLMPGESKVYRVRNLNGTIGSTLNVTDIEIEPASGTTENDFIVSATKNLTNLPRVTSGTSTNNYGEFTIKFTPQAEGVRKATIKVYSNGTPSPYYFTVIGGGRSCNVSNTSYVINTADTGAQTLASDLAASDLVAGNTTSPVPNGSLTSFYPRPSSGSYPLYSSASTSWYIKDIEKIRNFGGDEGVNISQLRNVSVEFNVAAFANSNSNTGVTRGDYVILSMYDNGVWKPVMQLNGSNSTTNSNRRKYQFNPTGRVFTKEYNLSLDTEENSSDNTSSTSSSYARSRFKFNIPLSVSKDITNFKFRITAKANTNAVWLIDDVRITSDNATYKTWNGTAWSGGTNANRPSNNEKAIFTGDFDFTGTGQTADLSVCECEVNNGVKLTIPTGRTLTVRGNITNNGNGSNFVIKDGGNLLQDEDGAINTGNITAEKVFTFSSGRQQYNYVSSPTVDTNVKSIYIGVLDNSLSALYYIESNDRFGISGGNYIAGRALALQEKSSGNEGGSTGNPAKFRGVPFNGIVNYPLAFTDQMHGYNLVGNPYPSNLDIETLYDTNATKIESTFYFWDNRGNTEFDQQGSTYNGDNYAKYNAAAGTGVGSGTKANGVSPANGRIPNRYVKVGTGFLVQAKSAGQTLNFSNTLRSNNNTGPGFLGRSSQNEEKDRFWLTLKTPADIEFMNAVVYLPHGSKAFGADDTESFGGSDDIFTIIDDKNLAIQGRSQFEINDQLVLGLSLFQTGTHTISIYDKEGIFGNGQSIYLKDKQTGIITNLSQGDYTFEAAKGISNNRFEIIYQPETVLVTDNKVKDGVVVYRDQSDFVVKAQSNKITAIQAFDSAGRLVYSTTPNSLQSIIPAHQLLNGIYILKINQGEIITTKKIIK